MTSSIIVGLLFALGFLLLFWAFAPWRSERIRGRGKLKVDLFSRLNLEKYQRQAEAVGWHLSGKELLALVLITLLIGLILAILMRNPLVVVVGGAAGLQLPRLLIEKKRLSNRIDLLAKLIDPLRMILSRLPEQQNITKVIEQTKADILDKRVRDLFEGYMKDVAIGGSVHDALMIMKRKVALRKFDVVVEYLVQAHYEGFTMEALRALNKAIEAIEFDMRAIEKVKEQSKAKKKSLYTTLATTWFFPIILSMANTGEKNIYLETMPGKILLLLFVIGSFYVVLKGEEYLSLNLDEL